MAEGRVQRINKGEGGCLIMSGGKGNGAELKADLLVCFPEVGRISI